MNPAPAVGVVGPARIGQRPDQGKRRDPKDQFRRALEQHADGTAAEPEPDAPARPVPAALQRQPLPSRREGQPLPRHVDVIA